MKESAESDKSYHYDKVWVVDTIKKTILKAEKEQNIPKFKLDKIEIHPSGLCNLNCSFCYGKNVAPKVRKMLSPEIIEKKVLKDIRENLPEENPLIILAGMYSEPLMHPKINEIIRLFGKYKFRFGLYTNGLLINDTIIKSLIYSAKQTKHCYVSFNITASLVTDNFYENLLPAIKKLVEENKKEKSPLVINTPIMAIGGKCDYDTIHNVINELNKAKVDNIRLSFPWTPTKDVKVYDEEFLSEKDYRGVVDTFKNVTEHFPNVKIRYPSMKPYDRCFAMTHSIDISAEGDVYPCPQVCSPFFKRFSMGSLLTHKFSEIWQSKAHNKLFDTLDPRKVNCICCPDDEEFNRLCAIVYWEVKNEGKSKTTV